MGDIIGPSLKKMGTGSDADPDFSGDATCLSLFFTQLSEIANLVDSGELQPVVENVFPLSEARKAQQLSQAGHTRGKIVLRIV